MGVGTGPGAAAGWWYALVPADDGGPEEFVVVQSDRHPDRTAVRLDAADLEAEAGDAVVCRAVRRGTVVASLHVPPSYAPKAPPVWFAEIGEPAADPPAVNLLAFLGAGRQPGDLVRHDELRGASVTSQDQLGALRWYPASGEVDQIYVSPDWRRRHVASTLVVAAGTLGVVRGWPRLWGDGQRTSLGERLRNASPWRRRAHDLTHLMPPMTPGETA